MCAITEKKCFGTAQKESERAFGILMVWRESKEHLTDCYFCLVNTKGSEKKNRLNIFYPSIPSAIRPVLHSDEFPSPIFNGFVSSEDEETESEEEHMGRSIKEQMQNLKTHLPKAKSSFPAV